jgi:hypothetical protein
VEPVRLVLRPGQNRIGEAKFWSEMLEPGSTSPAMLADWPASKRPDCRNCCLENALFEEFVARRTSCPKNAMPEKRNASLRDNPPIEQLRELRFAVVCSSLLIRNLN